MKRTPDPRYTLVSVGTWPFRRWLLIDPDGYPVAGNVNHRTDPGRTLLARARIAKRRTRPYAATPLD